MAEGKGGTAAKRGMGGLGIVEAFDVMEDLGFSFLAGCKLVPVN